MDPATKKFVPVFEPERVEHLWTLWRLYFPRHTPPEKLEIRTREDAHEALDRFQRRLDELFGPEPATDTPPVNDPMLNKPGKLILAALLKHYPTLQTIEEISEELKNSLSDRTIGPELKKLIDARLAVRPNGERKGATLTPDGKTLAEKLSSARNTSG
jgi:hypothetical protein